MAHLVGLVVSDDDTVGLDPLLPQRVDDPLTLLEADLGELVSCPGRRD